MFIGGASYNFSSFEPFRFTSIADGLRSRGLSNALASLSEGFSCIYDKVEKQSPASMLILPLPSPSGIDAFSKRYEVDTQRLSIAAYRYATSHDESHPMVDSFFVATLAALAFANSRVRHPDAWSANWSAFGPEVVWGALLGGGFFVSPGVSLALAPLAMMHIQRRVHARLAEGRFLVNAHYFYMSTICAPESWSGLRAIARQAIAKGVPVPSVIDLVLAKAERREFTNPKSSLDEDPCSPGVL